MNYTLEYIFIPQILANYGDDLAFDTVGVFVIFFRKSVQLMRSWVLSFNTLINHPCILLWKTVQMVDMCWGWLMGIDTVICAKYKNDLSVLNESLCRYTIEEWKEKVVHQKGTILKKTLLER